MFVGETPGQGYTEPKFYGPRDSKSRDSGVEGLGPKWHLAGTQKKRLGRATSGVRLRLEGWAIFRREVAVFELRTSFGAG